jgi:hypothetical protein
MIVDDHGMIVNDHVMIVDDRRMIVARVFFSIRAARKKPQIIIFRGFRLC